MSLITITDGAIQTDPTATPAAAEAAEATRAAVIAALENTSYVGGTSIMGELVALLVPLAFFVMIGFIVIMPMVIGLKKHKDVQTTIRHAIEHGTELPPEFISAMAPKEFRTPTQDLRRGLILIGAGVGIALLSLGISLEDGEVIGPLLGIAAIPAMIGIAHTLLWAINRKKDQVDLVE